ncbi:MAG: hypothetical protein ACREQ9_10040, partial [Candidatus Binatia bacterium]
MTERSRAWLSMRGSEPELLWMMLVSLGVHVVGLGALLMLPRELFSSAPPPVDAYTVKIVDPSALGGRLPKGALQPEKQPKGAVDAAPQETKSLEPEPIPEPKPEPKTEPEKKPEPKPEEKVVKIPEKKP